MKGSCFCGKICFEISGDIPGLYQCHCSECRKTTGSSANAGFIFPETQLKWLSGQNNIKTFVKDSGYRVDFCKTCGSPAPNHTSVKPEMLWVPAGLLDDDSNLVIKNHIFVDSKANWDVIGGDGHQYLAFPEHTDVLMK